MSLLGQGQGGMPALPATPWQPRTNEVKLKKKKHRKKLLKSLQLPLIKLLLLPSSINFFFALNKYLRVSETYMPSVPKIYNSLGLQRHVSCQFYSRIQITASYSLYP